MPHLLEDVLPWPSLISPAHLMAVNIHHTNCSQLLPDYQTAIGQTNTIHYLPLPTAEMRQILIIQSNPIKKENTVTPLAVQVLSRKLWSNILTTQHSSYVQIYYEYWIIIYMYVAVYLIYHYKLFIIFIYSLMYIANLTNPYCCYLYKSLNLKKLIYYCT